LILTLQALPLGNGQPAAWQFPTPTCDAQRAQGGVVTSTQAGFCCNRFDTFAFLGTPIEYSLYAQDVTPGRNPPSTVRIAVDAAGFVPPESSCSSCGIQVLPVLSTVTPPVSRLDVTWRSGAADTITEDSIPTFYCINHTATYGTSANNQACLKRVCIKICVEPLFVRMVQGSKRLLAFPSWEQTSFLCGSNIGQQGTSCLRLASGTDSETLLAVSFSSCPHPGKFFRVGRAKMRGVLSYGNSGT
jgi:hypothetical protein